MIANLSNRLIEKYEITIVSIIKSNYEYELNNKINRISLDVKDFSKISRITKKLLKLSIVREMKLKKVILKEKPDIIISFLPEPSFRILFLKKTNKEIKKIPVIVSERGDPSVIFKNNIIRYIMKYLYTSIDGFIYQTEEAKAYFSDIIDVPSKIIANPINSNFIVKEPSKKRNKTIVAVGRLNEQKNNKLLIDSFEKVCKYRTDYKLLFYGTGPLQTKLKKYIKELDLTEKIFFMGKSNCIEKDIYNAGIFVLSSNYEGMPNALMEAMALGLPCISTDCPVGGPKTLIKNGENGLLVPVGDEEALSIAILKLIEDNELSQKIANNALKISEKFNPNIINQQWEDFINKIINLKNN